jgi:hypothetical protein
MAINQPPIEPDRRRAGHPVGPGRLPFPARPFPPAHSSHERTARRFGLPPSHHAGAFSVGGPRRMRASHGQAGTYVLMATLISGRFPGASAASPIFGGCPRQARFSPRRACRGLRRHFTPSPQSAPSQPRICLREGIIAVRQPGVSVREVPILSCRGPTPVLLGRDLKLGWLLFLER